MLNFVHVRKLPDDINKFPISALQPDFLLTENNSVPAEGLRSWWRKHNINRKVESASLPDWNRVNV